MTGSFTMTITNDALTDDKQPLDVGISEGGSQGGEQHPQHQADAGETQHNRSPTVGVGKRTIAAAVGAIQKIESRRAELLRSVGAMDSIYVTLTADIVELVRPMSKAAAKRLVEQVRSQDIRLRSPDAGPVEALIAVARVGMPRTVKGSLSKCRAIAEEALSSGKDVLTLIEESNGSFWSVYDKLPKAPRKAATHPVKPTMPDISDDVAHRLNEGSAAVVIWRDADGSLVQAEIGIDAVRELLASASSTEVVEAHPRASGPKRGDDRDHREYGERHPGDGDDAADPPTGATEGEVEEAGALIDSLREEMEPSGEDRQVLDEIAPVREDRQDIGSEDASTALAVPADTDALADAEPAATEAVSGSEAATAPDKATDNEASARNEGDAAPAQGALALVDPAATGHDLVGRIVRFRGYLGDKREIVKRHARPLEKRGTGSRWKIREVTPELLALMAEMEAEIEDAEPAAV